MATRNLRVVPTVMPPAPAPRHHQLLPPAPQPRQQAMVPASRQQLMGFNPQPSGWSWDGTQWLCDPCDQPPCNCPPCTDEFPPLPPGCPPWFPPPAGQAPWYPGANGGVSFSQDAPSCPIRGHFWWDGVMLHLFDGAAWVDIGPGAEGAGGGVVIGTVPPTTPFAGQLWFDGTFLYIWNGLVWVPSSTRSFVQKTAPTGPRPGDMWWNGSSEWVWDGSAWQLIATSSGIPEPPGLPSVTPVQIPWSANIVPDFSTFINAYINVTGNFILGSPINVTPGQRGIIKLNQDVVGGHTWLVSPGWYFIGGSAGAPALSTHPNARDILHYYVGEQSIVYGELHADFQSNSGGTAPGGSTSTPIGNMTLNGGLAAAFDGSNSKTQALSARANNSSFSPGTFSGYVGKSFTTPQRLLSATYWPPNNNTGGWSGTAGGNAQYSLVINLRGKTGAVAPTGPTDGTLLATFSYGASAPSPPSSFFSSAAMVPNDMNTAFSFIFVEVAVTWNGSGPTSVDALCGQLILDAHT